MKMLISIAADVPFTKGARIVAKVGREWFVGTITRVGARVSILFDDGLKAVVEADDHKDVKVISSKTKVMKKPLSAAEAKALIAAGAKATVKPAATVKTKAAPAPVATKKTTKEKPAAAAPAASDFASWLGKLTPEKMKAAAAKLDAQIERMNAQGMRAARRAEDAGPMDIMWERVEPLRKQSELYKFAAAHPGKPLTKELAVMFKELQEHESDKAKNVAAKKETAAKYPNVVGHTIEWKNPKTGKTVETVVSKQFMSKFGAPKYKTQIEGMGGTWTIPHTKVLKFTVPKNLNKVKGEIESAKAEKAAKNKEFKGAVQQQIDAHMKASGFAVGQDVRYMVRRGNRGVIVTGKITSIGKTKITVVDQYNRSKSVNPLSVQPMK